MTAKRASRRIAKELPQNSRKGTPTGVGDVDRVATVGFPAAAAHVSEKPSSQPRDATDNSAASGKGAHASHRHSTAVVRRLARATGHLEAVKRMVEEGRDCPDVLIQLAAVRAALDATAKLVLADHVESCLKNAAHNGDAEAAWEDLEKALQSFIR